MSVTLTREAETRIRRWVESGRYASVDEALDVAVRQFDDSEQLQHLRSLRAVGIEEARRGELVKFTPELMDKLEREAEEAYQRGEIPDPDVCP